ncbi:hypothetical protein BRD00_13570 [Halobacteriales archaeon QS_8_69_26]|nr:MAG: hypothetical protein BRD00_13570 [Halobacteriales archaeon QS_8_69_26]
MDPTSRRGLLRSGARWLAVGTGVAVAGCNGLGGDGQEDRTTFNVPETTTTEGTDPVPTSTTADPASVVNFASLSVPEVDPPAYRQWLPAPSALFPDREGYRLRVARPARVTDLGTAVPVRFARHQRVGKLGLDHFGVGFEDYRWVLRIAPWGDTRSAVVSASFDRAAVAGTLTETGYERAGDHRGTWLFAREDGPRAVALGDGTLAWAAAVDRDATPGPRAVVRTLVDARRGAVDRYHEVDGDFEEFSRTAGGPLVGTLHAGDVAAGYPLWNWDLQGLVGWASTTAFDEGNSYLRAVFAFDRDLDPDRTVDELRRRTASEPLFAGAGAVDVTADDRSATVVAAVEDERYHDLVGDDRPLPGVTFPQITWGYDHDPAADEVTITHRGGDVVAAPTITVDYSSGGRVPQFRDEHDVVEPGVSLTVPVSAEDPGRITVSWLSPGVASGGVTGIYDVPEG